MACDRHTHHSETAAARSVRGSEGVKIKNGGAKVGGGGVKVELEGGTRGGKGLLTLQTAGRNGVSDHPTSVKRNRRKLRSHVTDHMTGCYGDVSPPPTPPYKDLRIGF